jgi:hypothetical protein
MRLKEKFYEEIKFMERAESCEQIADDYAIGFAEWVDDKGLEVVLSQKPKNTKELLTIYKKEKGL